MSKTKRPFYHQFSWAYDKIISAPTEIRCNFIERVSIRSGVEMPAMILDAGCGTGSYAVELAVRGNCVTGVDLSEPQLKQAKTKANEANCEVKFIQANLLDLLMETSFDLILCRGVLNDLITDEERSCVLQTFSSLLKPNGILIFDVRDWHGSVRQKTNEPVSTHKVITQDGELHFTSTTVLDHQTQSLKIHEQHKLTTPNKTQIFEHDLVMRCWSTQEIITNLNEVGINQIEMYGGWDESILTGTSERIVTVAQKV